MSPHSRHLNEGKGRYTPADDLPRKARRQPREHRSCEERYVNGLLSWHGERLRWLGDGSAARYC